MVHFHKASAEIIKIDILYIKMEHNLMTQSGIFSQTVDCIGLQKDHPSQNLLASNTECNSKVEFVNCLSWIWISFKPCQMVSWLMICQILPLWNPNPVTTSQLPSRPNKTIAPQSNILFTFGFKMCLGHFLGNWTALKYKQPPRWIEPWIRMLQWCRMMEQWWSAGHLEDACI